MTNKLQTPEGFLEFLCENPGVRMTHYNWDSDQWVMCEIYNGKPYIYDQYGNVIDDFTGKVDMIRRFISNVDCDWFIFVADTKDFICRKDRLLEKAMEEGGWRERFAIRAAFTHGEIVRNGNLVTFNYPEDWDYQDANGATYDVNRGWVN